MQPKAGSSPVLHVLLALAALLAAVGWWRAADLGGELRETRAAAAASSAELNAKVAGLERRLADTAAAAGKALEERKAALEAADRQLVSQQQPQR